VLALGTVLAMGCVGIPAPLKPAEPFEASRDLGQCYEIARLVWVEQDR
jgi:lipocalin